MAGSRTAHKLRLFTDRDLLHALVVAACACVLSLGLVYLGYVWHVLRVARRAPCEPVHGGRVLLFGKHAPDGVLDRDFDARIERAVSLWRERPPGGLLLLGGGAAPGVPTEAELAHRMLLARGLSADAPVLLESASRDTLENLRNARALLRTLEGDARVTLLSSRYHLARCQLFARQLGLDAEVCAAEPAWDWRPGGLLRIAGEAAYVCLTDIGTRWARLTRNTRMLARVT